MKYAVPKQGSTRRAFIAQATAVLALSQTELLDAATASMSAPQPLPLGAVDAGGDLGHRTRQNFTRLQADIYRPPALFRQTNWKSWPGDFEGRALLADILLSRSTGQPPGYLAEMISAYAPQLNQQGYFGPALDLHAINEQQLSGHGWYLRALCELYDWKRDPATLDQIRVIVRNLALPLRGHYASYPIDPVLRTRAAAPSSPGAVDGHLDAQHGDWAVSSDTCCSFIFLDGIAHAWILLRAANAPEAAPLKDLVDEAVDRFLQVDLVTIKAQTHATLTGVRGLLRIYAATGDPNLLAAARQRYRLYRTTGMTEHYANTNWFGRPDSWTEPCAIIDSFMVATQLWQHTDDPAYLEDAHRIWFNGVGRGLRANGGFGTDTCVGARSPFLRVRSYEAYFCCTMRGGEGHARAAQYLYFTRPGELTVPFFENSEARINIGGDPMVIRQTTDYPYAGNVKLTFINGSRDAFVLRLFVPSWTRRTELTMNGRPQRFAPDRGFLVGRIRPNAGDVLELNAPLRVGARSPISSNAPADSYAFEAGPLLLGYRPPSSAAANGLRAPDPAEVRIARNRTLEPTNTPGEFLVAGTDLKLSRINDLNDTPATEQDPCPRQILFREA